MIEDAISCAHLPRVPRMAVNYGKRFDARQIPAFPKLEEHQKSYTGTASSHNPCHYSTSTVLLTKIYGGPSGLVGCLGLSAWFCLGCSHGFQIPLPAPYLPAYSKMPKLLPSVFLSLGIWFALAK
jgi:hypothetical protein